MKFILIAATAIVTLFYVINIARFLFHRFYLLYQLLLFKAHYRNFQFSYRSLFSFFSLNRSRYSSLLIFVNGELFIIKLCGCLRKKFIISALERSVWMVVTYLFLPLPYLSAIPLPKTVNLRFDLTAEVTAIEKGIWNNPNVINLYPVILLSPSPFAFNTVKEGGTEELSSVDLLYGSFIYSAKAFIRMLKKEYKTTESNLILKKQDWKYIKKVYRRSERKAL